MRRPLPLLLLLSLLSGRVFTASTPACSSDCPAHPCFAHTHTHTHRQADAQAHTHTRTVAYSFFFQFGNLRCVDRHENNDNDFDRCLLFMLACQSVHPKVCQRSLSQSQRRGNEMTSNCLRIVEVCHYIENGKSNDMETVE